MTKEVAKIAIFKGSKIRKIWVGGAWWFSLIDVVAALTASDNPRDYWYKMKIREKDEAGVELSTICRQFKLTAPDGKQRETDCADTEGVFRVIQSIPSKKAEPFKRWLAKVGKERLDEIENPGLQGLLCVKYSGFHRRNGVEKRVRVAGHHFGTQRSHFAWPMGACRSLRSLRSPKGICAQSPYDWGCLTGVLKQRADPVQTPIDTSCKPLIS